MPEKTIINLYYTMAYPYLLYANLIWGGTNDVHLSPLVMLKKKLIRIINNAEFLAHTEPLFRNSKILKLKDLHNSLLAQYMYKHHPQSGGVFDRVHNYHTRNSGYARPAFQRLTQTQLSISCAGPRVWNALPECMRSADSLNVFKNQVKNYYLANYSS